MKLESLVTRHHHGRVNTFPGLVHTARQVIRAKCYRRRLLNRKEGTFEGVISEED